MTGCLCRKFQAIFKILPRIKCVQQALWIYKINALNQLYTYKLMNTQKPKLKTQYYLKLYQRK